MILHHWSFHSDKSQQTAPRPVSVCRLHYRPHYIIIIIIIRHAPCQCVAPLATNSLHSDLSKASSTASSKVRLCRDRSLLRGVGAPSWPTPIALTDTSQNPPGVSCLVHSGHVAKQHESSFLYDIREARLFRHTPHFVVGNVVVPANIKDPPQAPLIQCINLSGVSFR